MPRGMVTLDRIRLTGLLRKAPASSGAFYIPLWEVVGGNHSFQGADGTSAIPTEGACGNDQVEGSFRSCLDLPRRPRGVRRRIGRGRALGLVAAAGLRPRDVCRICKG